MLIDSHCHLHDPEFFTKEQAEKMLLRAQKKGVEKIVCIGTNHEDSLQAHDFASSHQNVYWTYGIHPENAKTRQPQLFFETVLSGDFAEKNEALIKETTNIATPEKPFLPPVAIGEVGLDYHYAGYDKKAQQKLFEQMLQLATENDLPVVFHVREAFDDFFPIVENFPAVRGVVHSFTDSKKILKRILNETDFFVGVNGLATYTTLPLPPLERILLETDAPFLTPKPFRGIINESGYIYDIARWLSMKLAVEFKIIERETTKNATELFKFGNSILRKRRSL